MLAAKYFELAVNKYSNQYYYFTGILLCGVAVVRFYTLIVSIMSGVGEVIAGGEEVTWPSPSSNLYSIYPNTYQMRPYQYVNQYEMPPYTEFI